MAVFYRLHQDQSTGTKRSGKWYARAVPTACIGTRQLAEIIQRNCTVKKSDREEVRRDGGTGGARRGHEGPDAGLQAREAGRLRLVQDRHRVKGCTDRRQVLGRRAREGSARRLHA